ncbi:MAG: queuosine precursor transporter [Gammaproteobacteria bacterium]
MNTISKNNIKYGDIIACLLVTFIITGVTLTYREVKLGSLILPGGVFAVAASFAVIDIIAEVYGYAFCRRLIWIIIICQIAASFVIFIVLHLPVPANWAWEQDYDKVLGSVQRVVVANVISSLLGYFLNAYLITKAKILTKGRSFWLRSILSSAVGEGIYNIFWVLISFGHALSEFETMHMMFSMWLYKIVFTTIINVPGSFFVKFLKEKEGIDNFDYNTNFSPFKLSIDE